MSNMHIIIGIYLVTLTESFSTISIKLYTCIDVIPNHVLQEVSNERSSEESLDIRPSSPKRIKASEQEGSYTCIVPNSYH